MKKTQKSHTKLVDKDEGIFLMSRSEENQQAQDNGQWKPKSKELEIMQTKMYRCI